MTIKLFPIFTVKLINMDLTKFGIYDNKDLS